MFGKLFSDPSEGRILSLTWSADSENPPLRLLLGIAPTHDVKELYPQRLATWAE